MVYLFIIYSKMEYKLLRRKDKRAEMLRLKLFIVIAMLCLLRGLLSPGAAEETLTITTYYPSPYGNYRELRAQRMAIGDHYIQGGTYDWQEGDGDGGEIYYQADLVVEGNVGIGTADPIAKLHILTPDTSSYGLYIGNSTYTTMGLKLGYFGTRGEIFGTHGEIQAHDLTGYRALVLNPSGGNVGIGAISPSYQFQLSTDSAAKPSTTTWTTTSDARVKKDIQPYNNGLEIIKKINPVWFKYNGKGGFPEDNREHIGVIAQEIQKVAPYTVNAFKTKLNPEDKEETELLNFNPHALIFDLINSVKELDSDIAALTRENLRLKKSNKELNQRLSNFQERLSHLELKIN